MSAQRLLPEPEEWVLEAACKSMQHLFFQPDVLESKIERRRRETKAKSICEACHVRVECLRYAVEAKERFGIWGGLTERERRAKFARLRSHSPQDIAGPGRLPRLPAVVVQGRSMSHED